MCDKCNRVLNALKDATLTQKASDYVGHIEYLLKTHDIRVVDVEDVAYQIPDRVQSNNSYALTEDRIVLFRMGDPVSDAGYAVVLHEMGHIVTTDSYSRKHKQALRNARHWAEFGDITAKELMLKEEQAAWDWAKLTALWWTPAMQEAMDAALSTYSKHHEEVAA